MNNIENTIKVANIRSIDAKIENKKKQGISFIVEFDNGNTFTCRTPLTKSNKTMNETIIQWDFDYSIVSIDTSNINKTIEFLLNVENEIVCWNKCVQLGHVNSEILSLLSWSF